jgi:threonine/homoserine/homoserine lactone efflux protein
LQSNYISSLKIISLLIILIFLTASLVSFIGSLQLGPVNLFVINSVLYHHKKTAFWVAVGGCLPEFIYCGLAVYANGFLQQSNLFQWIFKIVFILILIGIGFVFLLKKKGNMHFEKKSTVLPNKPFKEVLKGFSLAAFNPQLLPFWMFVLVYFNSIKWLQIKTIPQQISFIAGAGVGAFLLLTVLIMVVNNYKTKLLVYMNSTYFYKVLAILFFAIALQQLFSLIYNN